MFNGYETEELVKAHIGALLRSRAEYESLGDKDAVEACDKELRAFGHKASKPQERAEKRGPGRPRNSAREQRG